MNFVSVTIGLLAFLYGCYTLFIRIKTPEKFGKLTAMKKQWGEKTGLIIHTISYTILPWVIGILFIITGIYGLAI